MRNWLFGIVVWVAIGCADTDSSEQIDYSVGTIGDTETGMDTTSDDVVSNGETDSGELASDSDSGELTSDSDSNESAGDSDTTVSLPLCPDSDVPNPWIMEHFGSDNPLTGDFDTRTNVELPRLVMNASAQGAKYAFDLRDAETPFEPEAGFVNVSVTDLQSNDAYGAAIQPAKAVGAVLYLSNVYIEPGWPTWESYSTTNYDGIVLDKSKSMYAENLTISNWNADSALDIKSQEAQFMCLDTRGNGHRTLRFWQTGPHYIVNSTLRNETGDIIWIRYCDETTIYVYNTTFNENPRLPADKFACEQGDTPDIQYLTTDPRNDMHAMFSR